MENHETLQAFTMRFAADIPSDYYLREHKDKVKPQNTYCLKRNATTIHGQMGHFCSIRYYTKRNQFRVNLQQWRADEQAKREGELLLDAFGPGRHGLVFFVNPCSKGDDYQRALRAAKIVQNNVEV
jgi:hypothetical protein